MTVRRSVSGWTGWVVEDCVWMVEGKHTHLSSGAGQGRRVAEPLGFAAAAESV